MKVKRKKAKPVRFSSRLTSKYQATIPKEIRNHLHLEMGDEVLYEVLEDGSVVIRKETALDLEYLKALNQTLNEWKSKDDDVYNNL